MSEGLRSGAAGEVDPAAACRLRSGMPDDRTNDLAERSDRRLAALGRRREPRTRHAELLILCARIGYTPPV